jgi:hypothetical protein
MPATGKVVVDTSVVVAFLRRVPGLKEWLSSLDELLNPQGIKRASGYPANFV